MTSIVCDSCKKTVSQAVRGTNFYTVLDKSLCKACETEVEQAVRSKMAEQSQYHLTDYKKVLTETLYQFCR